MRMGLSAVITGAAPLALLLALAPIGSAEALTMKECGAKYQAAKKDGSLKGMKWNDFRKAQCGDDDVSDDEAAAAETAPAAPATTAAPAATKATAPTPTAKVGNVAYPKQVSQKYADESPGKARMHTCLDQYNANKAAAGGTSPVKWIEKGGGYYSTCNKRLKGA
jgi:hypothetical protein